MASGAGSKTLASARSNRSMPKRKRRKPLARRTCVRPLAAAASPAGTMLRAVLLAALAASAGCDSPREWPSDVTRAARRAGEWLGVIDAPRLAGEMPVVHTPAPAPSASCSSR
jgi:hypothetical protein